MTNKDWRQGMPRVKEIMTTPVIAITTAHTVFDALAIFNKFKISAIPVVEDEKGHCLAGIVSEGDCLKFLSHELFYDELSNEKIGLILRKDVKAIERNMDIFELEEFFQKQGIRHAPVVEDGKVVGAVSRSDILNHLEKLMNKVLDYRHDLKEPLELSMYKDFDTRMPDLSERHRFNSLN